MSGAKRKLSILFFLETFFEKVKMMENYMIDRVLPVLKRIASYE